MIVFSTLLVTVAIAAPVPSDVTVTGRFAADNGQEFEWTFSNSSSQVVNKVQLKHYHGVNVTPAPGWEESAMTGNASRGEKLEPGILEFSATSRIAGILPGQSKSFRVRMNPQWSRTIAKRTVIAWLEDGTQLEIRGVPCPAKASFLKQNAPVIGLGTMFAIFLIVKTIRGKKTPQPEA